MLRWWRRRKIRKLFFSANECHKSHRTRFYKKKINLGASHYLKETCKSHLSLLKIKKKYVAFIA